MLSHTDLKKGIVFILQGQPHEVLEASLNFRGRGSSTVQAKIRNLVTGSILSQTFRQSDAFQEAEIKKVKLKFLYSHHQKYVFEYVLEKKNAVTISHDRESWRQGGREESKKSKRIELTESQVGQGAKFLRQNQLVEGVVFKDEIINILLPIKVQLKVVEAPPSVRAGRAEAGTKQVSLESGAVINVPLFIEQGDVVEVNTETGEYVRRVE